MRQNKKIREKYDEKITSRIEVLNINKTIIIMVIPISIKNNVIREWLEGIPRDEIGTNNGISVGMISAIVTESRSGIDDIDLMREMALNLRKAGSDLNSFAYTVRLKNKLNRLGVNEDLVDSVIEKLHVHCFTKGLGISEFLSRLEYLIDLVNSIGVPIEHLDKYIFERLNTLERLHTDIQNMAKKRNDLVLVYKTTIPELEEFQQVRPIHEKLFQAEDENLKKELIIKEKDAEIKQLKEQLEEKDAEIKQLKEQLENSKS